MTRPTPLKIQKGLSAIEHARLRLLEFRSKHQIVFAEYEKYINEYNDAVNDTKNNIAAKAEDLLESDLGEFAIVIQRTLDPMDLIGVLGDDAMPFVKQELVLDRKALDKAIDDGDISQDVVNKIPFEKKFSIRGPKTLEDFTLGGQKRGKKSGGKKS